MSESNSTKHRTVSYNTFKNWQTELDKECKTITWLQGYTTVVREVKYVTKLKCSVCIKYESKIAGRHNYSHKWIVGADSIRNSNIKDHSKTDQHQQAMALLKRESALSKGEGPSSHASIA